MATELSWSYAGPLCETAHGAPLHEADVDVKRRKIAAVGKYL